MLIAKLAVVSVVLWLAAVLSDMVTAALIAGFFSVVNTVLLAMLHRSARVIKGHQEDVRKALVSPRRIVYDADGNPVGTVLDLHRTGGWDDWLMQQNRRADDPPSGPTERP